MKRIGSSKTAKRTMRRLALASPLMGHMRRAKGSASVPSLARYERTYLRTYAPHAKQLRIAEHSDVRYRAIVAGRRSGKTYCGGREFGRGIYRDYDAFVAAGGTWEAPTRLTKDTKPALLYWCVAPTYAVGTYQRQEFFEAIGGTDSDLIMKYVPSRSEVWLKGGILVQFKSADRPLDLVAAGLNGMWVDEAARFKEDAWEENLEPTLKDRQGWAIFTSTPLGKNWFYSQVWKHCLNPNDSEWYGEHFTTADNTTLPHLAEEMEKARLRLSRPVFLRNYMADFDAFEGKVYEDFLDDRTHLVKRVPMRTLRHRWGGQDWGHTQPGALISFGSDDRGNVYAWAEDYERGLVVAPPVVAPGADSWTHRMRRRDLENVWADPSLPGHISTCRMQGLQVHPAENGVIAGIDLVSTLLRPVDRPGGGGARPTLFIHEDLHNLRREMTSYAYGDDDKPNKEDDHACDALRYGLYTEYRRGTGLALPTKSLREDFPSIFDMAA